MTPAKFLACLAPAFALAGCISFGPDAPPSLLSLTPTASAPAGSGASGSTRTALVMSEFEAPARLDVTRVPVQVTDSEIAYLKDAVWVEKPARLFRRLLAETIRTRSDRVVIDGDDPGVLADARMGGTLREFGYDVATSSVVVSFDAVRNDAGTAVTTRRFEAVVPGVPAEAGPVGVALNQAANDVAGQVAAWIG